MLHGERVLKNRQRHEYVDRPPARGSPRIRATAGVLVMIHGPVAGPEFCRLERVRRSRCAPPEELKAAIPAHPAARTPRRRRKAIYAGWRREMQVSAPCGSASTCSSKLLTAGLASNRAHLATSTRFRSCVFRCRRALSTRRAHPNILRYTARRNYARRHQGVLGREEPTGQGVAISARTSARAAA
jgi:hypothetical protein